MRFERRDPFFVEAGGHRLRAQWIGTPESSDAETLVFLHEGLGSIGQWRGFPDALCAATGSPGLMFERWGYGASDRLSLPRPIDYMRIEAEDVLPGVLGPALQPTMVVPRCKRGGLLHSTRPDVVRPQCSPPPRGAATSRPRY